MNTKHLGALKNYTWPLKSDNNLSNTKKILAVKCCVKGTDMKTID